MNSNKGSNCTRTGFMLMEIMIVVCIIGLLVGIAVPSYKKLRESIFEKQTRQDLLLLQSCIDKLAWDTGRFPGVYYTGWDRRAPSRNYYNDCLNGTLVWWPWPVYDLLSSNAGLCSTDGAFPDWKGPYIGTNTIPRTDAWGSSYVFCPYYWKFSNGVWHAYSAVVSPGPDKFLWDDDDLYEVIQTLY